MDLVSLESDALHSYAEEKVLASEHMAIEAFYGWLLAYANKRDYQHVGSDYFRAVAYTPRLRHTTCSVAHVYEWVCP